MNIRPTFQSIRCFSGLMGMALIASSFAVAENAEITVYNQNFALVKDYHTLNLQKGKNVVEMDDTAALIDPTSVHFKSITAPQAVKVEEQNFRYDLISKSNILDRMVGKPIKFYKNNVLKEGILLNPVTSMMYNTDYYGNMNYGNNYNQQSTSDFAVKTSEGILLTSLGDVVIDQLPAGLYPRPTLVWELFSNQAGAHQTETSYLTNGMNWSCDYVAVLNKDDSSVDLTGWVTLNNNSGKSFEEASLKLVAGDVRRQQNPQAYPMAMGAMMRSDVAEAKQFSEESLFEYHLYTLNQKTTIANRETKQLGLLDANNIPVQKRYIFDPDKNTWRAYGNYSFYERPGSGNDTIGDKKVATLVTIVNSEANHLGMPLPKGKIRVNKADSAGSLQFVGEDQIDHTPKDEKLELYLGDAFDLVGEKRKTNYTTTDNWMNNTYEITLKNHKKQNVTINVYEHTFGDWKISGNSHPFKKEDAHTISFAVNVPANGNTKLTYTINVKRY